MTSSNITVDAQNLSISAGAALTAGGGTLGGVTTTAGVNYVVNGTAATLDTFAFQGGAGALAKTDATADPTDLTELIAGDKITLKIGTVEGSYIVQKGDTGDALVAGTHLVVWKIALTYAVPYCVATYGAVTARLDMLKRSARAT